MPILLIWQYVPESIECYAIPENASIVPELLQASGQYVNSSCNTEAVEKVSLWLVSEEGMACQNPPTHEVIEGPFSMVVICGVLL